MQCPVDGNELVMSERQGIEIDYCPKCRGVWLDRGELDKVIERSMEAAPAPVMQANPQPTYPQQQPGYRRDHDDDDDYRYGQSKKYKKKSLLGELFDF